jgi:phage terminase Nu1 subunit (DNA packaging protein)
VLIDTSLAVTQETFAALVGISQQRVGQMVAEGVLSSKGTAGQWLLAYVERLREQAAGRDRELTLERAALARSQRVGQEIKNAVAQKEYAPVGLLADVLAAASAAVVDRFDALSGDLSLQCPQLDEEAREVVLRIIASARNEWVRSTANLATEILDELADEADDDEGPSVAVDSGAALGDEVEPAAS